MFDQENEARNPTPPATRLIHITQIAGDDASLAARHPSKQLLPRYVQRAPSLLSCVFALPQLRLVTLCRVAVPLQHGRLPNVSPPRGSRAPPTIGVIGRPTDVVALCACPSSPSEQEGSLPPRPLACSQSLAISDLIYGRQSSSSSSLSSSADAKLRK